MMMPKKVVGFKCPLPYRRWTGGVTLGGRTAKAAFEVFPSGGGWSLLFGKPLLQAFKAIHNYKDDTLRIPCDGGWTVLANKYMGPTNIDDMSAFKGDVKSPSRQVLTSILTHIEHVDKQNALEIFIAAEHAHSGMHKPKRQG